MKRVLLIILVMVVQCYAVGDRKFNSNVVPKTTATFDLGSSSLKWDNVNAVTYIGDGSALTGIGSGTGGVINTGSTTIGADSDDNGSGVIVLQIGGVTMFQVTNAGNVEITNAITSGTWNGDAIDISDYTNLAAGTNITLVNDTLNVDDAFIVNNASDVMTGTLTSNGITITTGNALTVGVVQWDNGSDKIEGNVLADDSVDDDALDFTSITLADFTADIATTDLTDTANVMYKADFDTFSELQTQIADKTLVNEEDAAIIDSAWTFSGGLSGNLTGNVIGDLTGNADTAELLETTRTFSISGDTTAPGKTFNGGGNVDFVTSIAAGVIVDGDVSGAAAIDADKLTDGSTNAIVTLTQETNWDTHLSSDGSGHSFIDQDVTSGSSPVFDNTNMTGNISVWTNDTGYITSVPDESIQDVVGGMVSGNTEVLIAVTYDDGAGKLDFIVDEASIDHDALTNFVGAEHFLEVSISTVGTITNGVWQATKIDISDYTNLVDGTNLTLIGDTLQVDDPLIGNVTGNVTGNADTATLADNVVDADFGDVAVSGGVWSVQVLGSDVPDGDYGDVIVSSGIWSVVGISGDYDWLGASTGDWSDDAKTIVIDSTDASSLVIEDMEGEDVIRIDKSINTIFFGNVIEDPCSVFLGTGSVTFGGNLDMAGNDIVNLDDLFLNSGGVINFDSGDIKLTHSADTLTFSGGDLAFSAAGRGISGDWAWIGTDVAWALTGSKRVVLTSASQNALQFTSTAGTRNWLNFDTHIGGAGSITFGDTNFNPAFIFAGDGAFTKDGSGATTLGGILNLNTSGIITTDQDAIIIDGDLVVSGVDGSATAVTFLSDETITLTDIAGDIFRHTFLTTFDGSFATISGSNPILAGAFIRTTFDTDATAAGGKDWAQYGLHGGAVYAGDVTTSTAVVTSIINRGLNFQAAVITGTWDTDTNNRALTLENTAVSTTTIFTPTLIIGQRATNDFNILGIDIAVTGSPTVTNNADDITDFAINYYGLRLSCQPSAYTLAAGGTNVEVRSYGIYNSEVTLGVAQANGDVKIFGYYQEPIDDVTDENVGMFIGAVSGATTNWAIFSDGGDSFLTDDLIIGGALDVSGTASGIDPTESAHFATKEYVDTAVAGLELELFLDDLDSTINDPVTANDYYSLQPMETGEASSTLPAYAALGQGDDQEVLSYISDASLPFAELQIGIVQVHVHARKDNTGQKDSVIFAKLYHRADNGTETLITTTEDSSELTNVFTVYDLHGNLASVVAFSATDRLLVKIRADVQSSGGGNAQIEIKQEGDEDSRISTPVETDTLSNIFVRQDGTKQLTGDWDVGNFVVTLGDGSKLATAAAPTDPCDIANKAYADSIGGNPSFETDDEGYWSLSPADIMYSVTPQAEVGDNLFIITSDQWTTGFGGFCFAPVHLPNGITITDCIVYSNNTVMEWGLRRGNIDDGTTDVELAKAVYGTLVNGLSSVVDNHQFQYVLRMEIGSNASSPFFDTTKIFGGYIKFTYP